MLARVVTGQYCRVHQLLFVSSLQEWLSFSPAHIAQTFGDAMHVVEATCPRCLAMAQTCAPQKFICHVICCVVQPELRLAQQKPITIRDDTCYGCEDGVDLSGTNGAYQGKTADDRVGIRFVNAWHDTDKRCPTSDHIIDEGDLLWIDTEAWGADPRRVIMVWRIGPLACRRH